MAGIHCANPLLYSTPALVFAKEKAEGRSGGPADKSKKKKKPINTDEDHVPRGSQVFAQMGAMLFKGKEYRRALLALDNAVDLDESNKRPHLIRAAAFIRLGRYSEALKALDQVENPKHPYVLTLRTMASWYSGEFEQAAVAAARGNRRRTKPPFFIQMLNTSIGSIERCIGPSSGDILVELSKEIFQMEDEKRKRAMPAYGEPQYCAMGGSSLVPRKSTISRQNRGNRCKVYKQEQKLYQMQLHMGRLAVTNRFISGLTEEPGFVAPNTNGVERMTLLIKCVMLDLENRLEEMLMDTPMYVYKRNASIKKSEKIQKIENERHEEMLCQTRRMVEGMLLKIMEVRDQKIPLESIRICHRTRNAIIEIPRKLLPEKRAYLNLVYHFIGMALMEAKIKDPSLSPAAYRKEVLGWLGLSNKDVIMNKAQFPFMDYKSWLPLAMKMYPRSPSRLERCWLLHLIAVCYSGYGNHDGCRNHARRAVTEALTIGSNVWAINALVIQANAELHLNSKLDAKNSIKEAIDLAKELKDESIVEFLVQTNDALEGQSGDLDSAAEERRVNKGLVAMMPTQGMKNEMRHILHHRAFNTIPRRLPLNVQRGSPPNLGDTAEDAEKDQRPRLWPKKKRSG